MKPNYQKYAPKGYCGDPRRGAALGRGEILNGNYAEYSGRVYLSRIHLNSDAYDVNGTYWGWPDNLYWCARHDVEGLLIDFMVRANNRDDAKDQVRELVPNARFFDDPTPQK